MPDVRKPLDPLTNMWRKPRSARVQLLEPFVDRNVRIERWYGRTPDSGDQQYKGTVVAIATSTIGSSADLLILKTVNGTVWAISIAQIAYIELLPAVK